MRLVVSITCGILVWAMASDALAKRRVRRSRTSAVASHTASVALALSEPGDAFESVRLEMATVEEAPVATTRLGSWSGSGWTLHAAASLRSELVRYFDDDEVRVGRDKVDGRGSFDVRAGAKVTATLGEAHARLLVRRDLMDAARSRLEPDELTLRLALSALQITAGRTVVTWGRATLNSVVDVINPVDARDFLLREKQPTWVLRAGTTFSSLRLEALFLPYFKANRVDIPLGVAEDGRIISPNRWIDGTFQRNAPSGTPVDYVFIPASTRRFSPQGGARLATSWRGVDASVSYLYQQDPFPSVRSEVRATEVEGTTALIVEAFVEHYFRHVITLDAEWTLDRFHFVAEGIVALPQVQASANSNGTLPYAAMTAGFDYRSPRLFGSHELRLFVEATMTRALRGRLPSDLSDPTVVITRGRFPFPFAVMARGGYTIADTVTLGLLTIVDLEPVFGLTEGSQLDIYVRPEVEVALWHHFSLRAGLDLLMGAERGFFGDFAQNRRFTLAFEASY